MHVIVSLAWLLYNKHIRVRVFVCSSASSCSSSNRSRCFTHLESIGRHSVKTGGVCVVIIVKVKVETTTHYHKSSSFRGPHM